MFRSLLAANAVFVLLFSALILPQRAMACPEELPETLLSLYRNSSEIHIAKFDKVEEAGIAEEGEDYRVIQLKKHFSISSTLRGESRKFFVLDEQQYRYTGQTDQAEQQETPEYDDYGRKILKSGDDLILFLKAGEDGMMELTHYRDGIKPLKAEHIGAYEARINELRSIFAGKEVSDAAIVDWLIRCIEDPVTRWEGAFELLQSAENLQWKEEEAARVKTEGEEKTDTEEMPVEDTAAVSDEAPEDEEIMEGDEHEAGFDNSAYAKLLTDAQKTRLADILFAESSDENSEQEKTDEIVEQGNKALSDLIQRWGDPRVPGYLLERLALETETYLRSEIMYSAARIIGDEQLQKIAEEYSNIAYEDDDAEVPVTSGNGEGESAAAGVEAEIVDVSDGESAVEAPKMTYRELKQKLVEDFTARANEALAAKAEKEEVIAAAQSN